MEKIQEVYREACAAFSILRTLGFSADDICIGTDITGVFVSLVMPDTKTFTISVGYHMTQPTYAHDLLMEAVNIYTKLPQNEAEELVAKSKIRHKAVELITAMAQKGIFAPSKEEMDAQRNRN